uniref:Uncharacterized protein n=1 Tax=Hucho hucho TaxID=62062 RepID=A0A4W5MSM4_9TELE
MDTNSLAVLKLLLVGILVNSWMTRGSSATENINVESIPRRPSVALCNETQLLWEMEVCGEGFKREMAYVDPQNWCNLTHFISQENGTAEEAWTNCRTSTETECQAWCRPLLMNINTGTSSTAGLGTLSSAGLVCFLTNRCSSKVVSACWSGPKWSFANAMRIYGLCNLVE